MASSSAVSVAGRSRSMQQTARQHTHHHSNTSRGPRTASHALPVTLPVIWHNQRSSHRPLIMKFLKVSSALQPLQCRERVAGAAEAEAEAEAAGGLSCKPGAFTMWETLTICIKCRHQAGRHDWTSFVSATASSNRKIPNTLRGSFGWAVAHLLLSRAVSLHAWNRSPIALHTDGEVFVDRHFFTQSR